MILQEITQKISTLDPSSTMQQVCDLAMDYTVLHVGEVLSQNRAILLPTAHDFFGERVDEILVANNVHSTEAQAKKTSRLWVLSHLTMALKHHLEYKCKVRKYGTLLFLPSTDFIPLL